MDEIDGSSRRHYRREPQEIWVNEFTENSAQRFREQLFAKAKSDTDRPIVIYIDSYGGYVDSLAKMIASMDEIASSMEQVRAKLVSQKGLLTKKQSSH